MAKVVDCLVGLQWGSEGKGKISAYLANEYNAMVRSGGPQAGHTFYDQGEKFVNRHIPCGVKNEDCYLYLSASSLINIDVFAKEIQQYKLYPDKLMIDNHAMVVTQKHIKQERKAMLNKKYASTVEGVGAAQSEKVWRTAPLFEYYANEDPELFLFANDTQAALDQQIRLRHKILLEGTQGAGLDLNHGFYPYATSRSVIASTLLSDAGIAPQDHNQTIGVMRTYPIRVAGNSGHTLSDEITWKEIAKRSGSPNPITEYTTVTKKVRRVFEQSPKALEKAISMNKPDQIALMFIDYINFKDFGVSQFENLSTKSKDYVNKLEDKLQIPITLIGTGPLEEHIIDMRSDKQKVTASMRELNNEFWSDNIYGYDWDSGFIHRFIDRKTTDKYGKPWKRKIFIESD